MGAIQYLLEDKSGTVFFDVPRARPSAATVTVKTSGNGDIPDTAVEGENATIDTFQRTVKTWVATAPRDIELNTGTGTPEVGRRYLARTYEDRRETVIISAVDSDDIEISDSLPWSLAAGDYIESTRISYALSAAQLADRGLFRCEWTYTVDSEVRIAETLFRTVKALPYNPASAAGLRSMEPELVEEWDEFVTRNGSWAERVDIAWAKVLQEIEGRKVVDDPSGGPIIDKIVDWSQAEESVYRRVIYDMAPRKRPNQDWEASDWVRHCQAEYKRALEHWLSSVRWMDNANADRVLSAGESGRDRNSLRFYR